MVTKIQTMKVLKISKFTFISYFMFSFSLIIIFLIAYLYAVFYNGHQLKNCLFLVPISFFGYFLFIVINYYLYDKDTIIEIDANGDVIYSNTIEKHFHLEDIEICTEAMPSRLYNGFTEITLKDGSYILVSNFISLEPIYKINPNIKREKTGLYWPIILKRKSNNKDKK